MIRLDGSAVAKDRKLALREKIEAFEQVAGRKPGLAVIIVGADPASQVYVRNKVKTTESLGMASFHFELPSETSEADVIALVKKLNQDPAVDGILVQLPLPKQINTDRVIDAIDPAKDPDGLTIGNLGLLLAGRKRVAPCTPWGVIAILKYYGIEIAGRQAVVIGRSNIVGKPMAQLLLEEHATVASCHSKTKDLFHYTQNADIVVVAAGQPRFIGAEAFRKGAVVIDVGIHRPTTGPFAGKLCGDVRYEELEAQGIHAASPVPGGVGPMTIQMLMENTVRLAELKHQTK